MIIIELTYKVAVEMADKYMSEHLEFINKQYELGNFIASGKKEPRTGGIILSNMESQSDLEKIMDEDPFKIHDITEFKFTKFIPSRTSEDFKFLIESK
ncbi:YciI family protein [Sediminitomix flava]|uniref:Uncharacterized protein YciI n=1 Tax=Sediminitomix flava TaxID=379075 RepID=A0A315Z6A6_SEDFL|nr:YciI family protein [Sediminitomix flava]PWJ39958.1 uncharacterized protein YciI [Sediminitomix flava]